MANKLSRFFLLLVCLMLFSLVFNSLYPYKVLSFNVARYIVLTPVVRAGNYLSLEADYCKYMPVPSHYAVEFIDVKSGAITPTDEKFVANTHIGCRKVPFNILIPTGLYPGRYFVRLNIDYGVNSLRRIEYTIESEEFDITEGLKEEESKTLNLIYEKVFSWERIE